MAKIVNYVYSMIIFLFLFLVATKAERKPFITFKIFFPNLYTLYYPILVAALILISFFITRVYQCIADSDCQPWMCSLGMKPKCISVLRMCKCHGWQKYNVLT